MTTRQLALDFDHRPALQGEDFLVAPCNKEAIAWIDRWPDWPTIALVIHGPVGCGKTHLAQVFRGQTQAVNISATDLENLEPPIILGKAKAGLLDNLDVFFSGERRPHLEEALLHLYNTAKEQGVSLMMTAKAPPSRWPLSLPDLTSRLKTATAVEIGPPDDALLAAVLVKQFGDRQLRVDADVVAFVQSRVERSFGALGRLVERADKMAMAEKRRITVPLIRQVLRELEETDN